MSDEALRRHHVEQDLPNSCVAATLAIIQSRRGTPTGESSILAKWSGQLGAKGLDPAILSTELGVSAEHDSNDATLLARARVAIEAGHWVVAFVMCWKYGPYMTRRALLSRHGSMSSGTLHTLVLCACAPGAFDYLDPYLPGDAQPLRINDIDLAAMLSHVLVVP